MTTGHPEPIVEHISLIFKGPEDAPDVEFKVKSTTKMVKVIKAWAEKRRVDPYKFRFLVHGGRFDLPKAADRKDTGGKRIEDITVADLDLRDGDFVEVGTEHFAGGPMRV